MQKHYQFSVTCPFCGRHHERTLSRESAADLPNDGRTIRAAHFACCEHEIGFSVRRVIGGAA